ASVLQKNGSTQPVSFGRLGVPESGMHELELRPESGSWSPAVVRSIKLIPEAKSADGPNQKLP
ncbi:MAG TPA: hypothetical protein VFF11_16955, partial [Candidatus Binatia bacterium]|nr:hypothetical protein [Candidatus Binatia bacterium]